MTTPAFDLITEARQAVEYGLHDAAERIARVIKADAWREFDTPSGKKVQHSTFESFVEADPPRGFGTTVDILKRVCYEPRYGTILDEVLQHPHGGDRRSEGAQIKRDIITLDPNRRGTSVEGALRRLRKDRPDLLNRVLDDALSPNAAMIEAGFRQRTISIRIDDLDSIARTLRKHLTDEQIEKLKVAL